MSDYDDDGFDEYDDEDDFENEEDDYDVLPSSMTKASVKEVPKGEPAAHVSSRRPGTSDRPLTPQFVAEMQIPNITLSEAQLRARAIRLKKSLWKAKQVELQLFAMDDLYQMAALSEYDLFTMARSSYSTKKAGAVQTNADDKEQECQTDDIDDQDYSVQVPEDRNQMTEEEVSASSGPSGHVPSSQWGVEDAPRTTNRLIQMEAGLENKLNDFMQWAGPMVLAALGLAAPSQGIALKADPNGGVGITSGIVSLAHQDLLANRPVSCLSFSSSGAEPLLLVSYGPVGAQLGAAELITDHSLGAKGCLCVWDMGKPARPRAVLISEGSPSCCTFAPASASHVVFAGMEEGGVCAWDLEESESRHPVEQVGSRTMVTRRPSYSTEFLADVGTSGAPIAAVAAVHRSGDRSSPCSLVSVSTWGDVTVWTISLLALGETAAGELDFGLRIGSRLRMLRTTSSVRLGMNALKKPAPDSVGNLDVAVQAFSIQTLTSHPRQFVVGADGGKVLRGCWVGVSPAPKEYIAGDHNSAAATSASQSLMPSCVTSLHISPFWPNAFLAGHDNGSIVLHSTEFSSAAVVWPSAVNGKVAAVRWSPARPCVFFALDSLSTVHCFDLTQSRSGSVHSQSFMRNDGGVPSIASVFEVTSLGAESLPAFALGYDDGHVDVHAFSGNWTQSELGSSGELKLLHETVGVSSRPTPKRRN